MLDNLLPSRAAGNGGAVSRVGILLQCLGCRHGRPIPTYGGKENQHKRSCAYENRNGSATERIITVNRFLAIQNV